MNKPGIYKIINMQSNKFYIGSAVNLRKRISRHKWDLKNNRHPNKILQNIYDKHSLDILEFIVLEIVEDKTKLIEREQFYIDTLKPEYNLTLIAGSQLGLKRSDETRKRMSKSLTGKIRVGEARENGRQANLKRRGKKLSKEHIKNAVEGRIGYVHSEEVKLKISKSHRKNSDWSHEAGNKCNCEECKERRNSTRRLYKGPVEFVLVTTNE